MTPDDRAVAGPAASEVYALSDRATDAVAAADPLTATWAGIAGHDERWPDLSPAGHALRAQLARDLVAEARACPVAGPEEALAQRLLVEDLTEQVDRHEAGDHWRDLDSIASSFQGVHDVLGVMTDPDPVAARLSTVGEVLGGWRETLAEGVRSGVVVARRQVLAAIEQGRVWASPEGFEEVAGLPGCAGPAAEARAAYAATADWLATEYLPHAEPSDAVGPERYGREARRHLGTTIDPVATYEWGWSEIRRLRTELAEVCAQIAPGEPTAGAIDLLRTDPSRAAAGAAEFLSVMQERQDLALAQLGGTHFDLDDRIRAIEVRAAPPGGALAPRYSPPSEDFTRAGCVWYPLGDRTRFPLWEEVTTAHHEGVPGHHLQVGTQMALGDGVSRYHRTLVWKPGSGEGWALYAERLMGELGYLDRPDYVAGQLAASLFRACRIVIDLGLHLGFAVPHDAPFHPGATWTPELAEEVLRAEAFVEDGLARSEVVRYLGWPAQAISYKLGERAIVELRERRRAAAAAEGQAFDPVAFHRDVLHAGAIGLDLLADTVG